MRKKILIIIGVLILIAFVFGFSYWLIYERIPQKEAGETLILEEPQEEPKTKSVQKITLSGEVKEIRGNSLVLFVENELLEILINEETKFNLVLSDQEKAKTPEEENGLTIPNPLKEKEIEFKDIKVGDKVNIFTKQENEKLIGISVLVSP